MLSLPSEWLYQTVSVESANKRPLLDFPSPETSLVIRLIGFRRYAYFLSSCLELYESRAVLG